MTTTRRFGVHGVTVHVEGDDGLTCRMQQFFEHLGLETIDDEGTRSLHITAEYGSVVPPPGNRGWQELQKAGFSVRFRDGEVEAGNAETRATIDTRAGAARLVFRPDLERTGKARMNLAAYALLNLLRKFQLFPMHAAAGTLGDSGVLIVADSGGGKSTLASSLLESGWQHLTDDSLLLHPADDGIRALALRRDLFLLDGGGWRNGFDAPSWPNSGKQRVAVAERFGDRIRSSCRPTALVFPTIVDRAESRLVACADDDALVLLAHHGMVTELDPRAAAENMTVLRDLVHQCAIRHLEAGRDLLEDRNLASRILTPLCENSARRKTRK